MDLSEIPEGLRNPYTQTCSCCGLDQTILTQHSDYPEYETEIYLICQCGEYIEFILPVN
jgi:hypothetical protein